MESKGVKGRRLINGRAPEVGMRKRHAKGDEKQKKERDGSTSLRNADHFLGQFQEGRRGRDFEWIKKGKIKRDENPELDYDTSW